MSEQKLCTREYYVESEAPDGVFLNVMTLARDRIITTTDYGCVELWQLCQNDNAGVCDVKKIDEFDFSDLHGDKYSKECRIIRLSTNRICIVSTCISIAFIVTPTGKLKRIDEFYPKKDEFNDVVCGTSGWMATMGRGDDFDDLGIVRIIKNTNTRGYSYKETARIFSRQIESGKGAHINTIIPINGDKICVTSGHGLCQLWDVESKKPKRLIKFMTKAPPKNFQHVEILQLSSTLIVIGNTRGEIDIWNINPYIDEKQRHMMTLNEKKRILKMIKLSDTVFATTNEMKRLNVWDIDKPKGRRNILNVPLDDEIIGIAVMDNLLITIDDGRFMTVWDISGLLFQID